MKAAFHKIVAAALSLLCVAGSLTACTTTDTTTEQSQSQTISFTDALGNEVQLYSWERVVSLYGSFAEIWTLAGGSLIGVTEDAIEERGMEFGEEVAMIGSVKTPNMEEIIAVNPDFVILSADVATQVDLQNALQQANIPHAYFRVDTFEDYEQMLSLFCAMTERPDLYETYGVSVSDKIEQLKALTENKTGTSTLLIRAFSTGAKAKGTDNLTGVMLAELGADNIVERHDSLLEDLSIEEIIAEDPDTIFITTMGDEADALAMLETGIMSNPAWAGLTAVQNDRCFVLPKELFHYKPNARWAESYAQLTKYLYPELTEAVDEIMA